MTFLDPVNLSLLGLLLVLAAAYLLRMPRTRLRVPDALIARLALSETSRINRQKRTLVSLAIQVFILLLLVAAAAKPYLGDADESHRSIIVLFDVSASMGALDDTSPSSRFERARAAVGGLARSMRRGDRMMLMSVGGTPNVVLNFEEDRDLIERTLDALVPTAEEADFTGASRLAASMARSGGGVEIVLVTDGALRPDDLAPLRDVSTASLKVVRVGARSANVGITVFRVRRNLDSPTDYEALVSIANASDETRTVEVELLLDGSVFDVASVEVPAGGEAVQVFREKLRVGGILEARLHLDDALASDNVAWEVLKPRPRLRVLLVSDDTSASSFLVRAVGSNATALEGMVITPEQYREAIAPDPSVLRSQRDAVIFDRWVPDDASQLPPTHLLALDCVPPGMPAVAKDSFDKPLIRKWERGHPLMSYLNLRNVFVTSARRVEVTEPEKGQRPVERVADMVTSPLVLAWEREMPNGRGADAVESRRGVSHPQRFVVIAFNPRESDIVLRKELPLLLWNSFLWFAKDTEPPTQASPGATIALAAGKSSDAEAVTVLSPDGTTEAVRVDPETGVALFGATAAAGVYRTRAGDAEDAFVVNAGARFESDVRPAADLGIEAEMLDADALARVTPAGLAMWPYLLFAACLVLAFEAVVYHRRVYF